MASIFTFQEDPHRVHSPWSTPGSSTPQKVPQVHGEKEEGNGHKQTQITKLEPEKHDGPTEYKLHLLLRPRRTFSYISTTAFTSGLQQMKSETGSVTPHSVSETRDGNSLGPAHQPANHVRQARLQQLTTQLLWRLQQSSPFHSSSNAKLVLPVLPEATPRLGVPDRPSKLLPGLEESQGALYEIGVADDGTLVGLAEEEIEESLSNLRAMSASLGCVVDVLRRVVVGECEWTEYEGSENRLVSRSSQLWVAEVLVRPDNKSVEVVQGSSVNGLTTLDCIDTGLHQNVQSASTEKEQVRVALVGATAAGKSSLLGTLTNSMLDNGRGKSRLSLLKHRHEIASGITSSVAQELLGYRKTLENTPFVVNYASGDVSSWPDIHDLADRLVLVSDSPGLPRYSKSTFRALLSWSPAWTLFCISADDTESGVGKAALATRSQQTGQETATVPALNLSLSHLDNCLKLNVRVVVVITKMDVASKIGLRVTLSKVLSALKAAGKTPAILSSASVPSAGKEDIDVFHLLGMVTINEEQEMEQLMHRLESTEGPSIVPIIMTSAVTGSGIARLHAMLRSLPMITLSQLSCGSSSLAGNQKPVFAVDEVFAIPPSKVYSEEKEPPVTGQGIVLCGVLKAGRISLGDELAIGPFLLEADNDTLCAAHTIRRSSSHSSKLHFESLPPSFSDTFSKSLQLEARGYRNASKDVCSGFIKVRVVSLRTLRLPVRSMQSGETGTIGVQLSKTESKSALLTRARKGMILTHPSDDLTGFRSFVASFPASDFCGTSSPPLILGGHAIAYIDSIRAAVKVIAVALEDGISPTREPSSAANEVFSFDDDDDDEEDENDQHHQDASHESRDIRITFKFVSTLEYIQIDQQVLVVPTMSAAGPVAGPALNTTIPGLSGFVGRIRELVT